MTRAQLKALIRDDDRVFVGAKDYTPQTPEHARLWPTIKSKIGEKGAWYSTLRALTGGNHDYSLYLIADIGALTCPRVYGDSATKDR
jgi:hypothetical protein